MKHLIISIVMIFAFATIGIADENPDSRPSITFALGHTLGSAEHHLGVFGQKADVNGLNFTGVIKVPTSKDITVSLIGGYSSAKTEWNENLWFSESKVDFKTYTVGFSVTFYIGESVNR